MQLIAWNGACNYHNINFLDKYLLSIYCASIWCADVMSHFNDDSQKETYFFYKLPHSSFIFNPDVFLSLSLLKEMYYACMVQRSEMDKQAVHQEIPN